MQLSSERIFGLSLAWPCSQVQKLSMIYLYSICGDTHTRASSEREREKGNERLEKAYKIPTQTRIRSFSIFCNINAFSDNSLCFAHTLYDFFFFFASRDCGSCLFLVCVLIPVKKSIDLFLSFIIDMAQHVWDRILT